VNQRLQLPVKLARNHSIGLYDSIKNDGESRLLEKKCAASDIHQ
jgi:hypothetical protein